MGRKVFVSYKYKDNNVQSLWGVTPPTWPCDYVDYIRKYILSNDDIYKGEDSDEDISSWSENAIWNHLKNKIYDSTITILLISPNMKEEGKWQKSQWIPWEISYSLRETTRNDRTSHSNAILAVILPDKYGNYRYYSISQLFPIVKSNIDNGYIQVVNWEVFKKSPQYFMDLAIKRKEITPSYRIVKLL
ncbi:MTH538 TIR-like domain [Ruminococcaceae bacterium YAD3003]|nr:MTH538 TIR-like domain [Ruminococcaceae bacterium YAD3003]